MTKSFYVYLHKTSAGEVFYVGKGKGGRAWSKCSRSSEWKSMVESFGLVVQIVAEGLTEPEAYAAEVELVAAELASGSALCNKTIGGGGTSGRVMQDEQKRKIGDANRIALAGKKLPQSVRAAISKKMTGRRLSDEHRSNLKGRVRSQSHAKALSSALVGNTNSLGVRRTESKKAALSEIAKSKRGRRVICLDSCQEFRTVRDAAEYVRPGSRAADGNIVACCNGRLASAYGRVWKYLD